MTDQSHFTKDGPKCFVSVFNKNQLTYYEVPPPVYEYIIQLECAIKYGSDGIKKRYPFRFKETEEQFTTPIVPDETMQWMVQNFGENNET
jgi:hypothetical protein